MNWLIIKNDFKRNKVINIALLLFMTFSSALAVLAIVIGIQTFSSISELYDVAKPPHFLQMHKGEFDENEVNRFMEKFNNITYYQTVTMIDVYGEEINVVGKDDNYDLSSCKLDIGLVKQNKSKDLLLNSKHNKVTLSKGEIGIPSILKDMYNIEIGDSIILNCDDVTKEFIVKEIVLDSMMNSTMCSSTRILLSEEDFESLKGKVGEIEYIIEAYFTNSKEASSFTTKYENAGMPQNGQAITYSMMFLLSGITDVITVFILILVSILLIIVSFICIKYTVMAALEEELSEVGIMKAIGLKFSNIRSIYMVKYRALAIVGVVLGYISAFLINGIFSEHIKNTFGHVEISFLVIIVSVLVAFMVFLLINQYCKKVLKKIKKITVVDALVNGTGFEKNKGKARDGIYKSKSLSINWLIALREVFYKFRRWIIVFTVVSITVLMMLIPIKLMNTFQSTEFVTYMGSPLKDILIEIENGENLEKNYLKTKDLLDKEKNIKSYDEYKRVCIQTIDNEEEFMNIHIDCGSNAGKGLKYFNGNAPNNENEIAISYLNSEQIGKGVGDRLTLFFNSEEKDFIISGVYQDVTSGGYTAKIKYNFANVSAEKYSFTLDINNKEQIESKAEEWSKALGAGIVVDPMEDFLNQTLGGVVEQIKTVVLAIIIIGLVLVMLITVLFLKLRLAKDASEIAALKAIGFRERDIKNQYIIKIGVVSIVGILVGILISSILGEKIVNGVLQMAGLGIKEVQLITNPLVEYIVCPLLVIVMILLVTNIVVRIIKKYNIMSIINK